MQILVISSDGFDDNLTFLSVLRMIRLLRLFVIMNKVQKTRAAYKKKSYLKLGSPVERVMDLLADLKNRSEEETVADLEWVMQLIASDKLYSIDLRNAGGGKMDSEMAAFLTDNLGLKKEAGDLDGESETGTATDSVTSLSQVTRGRRLVL